MWRHVYDIQNLTQPGSDATVTESLRFGIYVWSSNRSYLVLTNRIHATMHLIILLSVGR